MHKVGIISDTHGLLRPEVLEALKGCELILHGGDINRQEIVDKLRLIAPVYAVRGNNDSGRSVRRMSQVDKGAEEWAKRLPETLILDVFGLNVFLVHNKKFIPEDLTGIQLIVYGHSHKYEEKYIDGVWYLNPGSCGPRRFRQDITMAVLYIEDGGNFKIEKIIVPYQKNDSRRIENKQDAENGIPEDLALMLPVIMREIDSGKSVGQIARKHHISEELSDQINRMYLTHPGVSVDGILRRLGL